MNIRYGQDSRQETQIQTQYATDEDFKSHDSEKVKPN